MEERSTPRTPFVDISTNNRVSNVGYTTNNAIVGGDPLISKLSYGGI